MAAKITTCERCKETLIGHPESPRRPVPVTYGETDMTICYRCAVELTLLIGNWIDTEPTAAPLGIEIRVLTKTPDDPVRLRHLPQNDDGDFVVECFCLKCGAPMKLLQPAGHSEYNPSGTCDICGRLNLLVFDFDSMAWEQLTEKPA